jgi:hypothetical protein
MLCCVIPRRCEITDSTLDEAMTLGLCDKVRSDCCPAHAQIELERRVTATSWRRCTRRVVARLMVNQFWPSQGSDANRKEKTRVVSLMRNPSVSLSRAPENNFWSHTKIAFYAMPYMVSAIGASILNFLTGLRRFSSPRWQYSTYYIVVHRIE